MTFSPSRATRGQQGFTLIELMIALVLGLIVIGGIGAVFLSSNRTYQTTQSLSRTQESARFAVQYISRELQVAGYVAGFESGIVGESVLYPGNANFTKVGQVVVGNRVSTDSLAGSDSIEIRYGGSSSDPITDCLGNDLATAQFVTVRLYVNNDNELVCSVNGLNAEPLVEGIANMSIEYGVNDPSVAGFLTSASFAPVGARSWVDVVSAKVTLAVLGDARTTGNRNITSVIALRNQLP